MQNQLTVIEIHKEVSLINKERIELLFIAIIGIVVLLVDVIYIKSGIIGLIGVFVILVGIIFLVYSITEYHSP